MKKAPLTAESLLEHKEFVRNVARRILPDEHLVEDVVQETYLRALRSPPRRPSALRAWMGRVARNVALTVRRSGKRRHAREQAALPSGGRSPSPSEATEKLESHRLVVDAVLGLDEPMRSAIIYSYYEDLPPREIARLQGVSVAAAQSRLRRAVARLRTRLDAAYAGDRAAWSLALLPLVFGTAPVATGGGVTVLKLGGVVMKAKLTVAGLAVCILGTAIVVWRAADGDEDRAGDRADEVRRQAPVAPDANERDDPRRDERRERAYREVQPDRPGGKRGVAAPVQAPPGEAANDGKKPAPGATPDDEEESAAPPPPRGFVTGRVRIDGDGLPSDAQVVLRWRDDQRKQQELDVRPDANGEFLFDAVAPGRYRLEATHPDFARRSFEFELKDEQGAGPFDLLLTAGGAIRVLVRGPDNEPLADQKVRIRRQRDTTIHSGRTDTDGIFLLEHLAPGRYDVQLPATGEDGRSLSAQGMSRVVTVRPGKTLEVTFASGCSFTGLVADADGEPLPGAYVNLIPVKFGEDGYRQIQTKTDDEGRFELTNFAPGEYTLRVQVVGEESWVVEAGRFRFEPRQVRDEVIRISPSYIAGRITRADTGEGPGQFGVSVQAYPVKREGGKVVRLQGTPAMAFADDDGYYKFVGLEPGLYRIWVFPKDKALKRVVQVVDFTAGGRMDGLDFVLKTQVLGTLELTVLEPDGTPATGLDFSQKTPTGSLTLHGKEIGAGVWEFKLQKGETTVYLMRSGYEADPLKVSVAANEKIERTVRLREKSQGKLRVTVLEADGSPAADVDFWLQIGRHGSGKWPATKLADGVHELTLKTGTHTLHLQRGKTRLQSIEVTIAEDETADETVKLGE